MGFLIAKKIAAVALSIFFLVPAWTCVMLWRSGLLWREVFDTRGDFFFVVTLVVLGVFCAAMLVFGN